MFYISKAFQAFGLSIIVIDFLRKFPNLMNPKVLGAGIILFVVGWIIENFLLTKR